MPTAKARYKGDGAWTLPRDFSDDLKETLRDYYPDQQAKSDPTFGHPADNFVSHILAEAREAISELHWHQFDITKSEIRAEQRDLLSVLNDAHDKLQNLSPDFDRLLGVDGNPLGCADNIKELIAKVEHADQLINNLPSAKRCVEKQHDVIEKMAIQVLRALKEYKIDPSATADTSFGYTSKAVKILMAIGGDIGLVRSALTWRDIIIKAKQAAPDLQ